MRKEKHNDEGFITIDCHIIIGRPQGKGEAQTHRVTLCVCVCVCVFVCLASCRFSRPYKCRLSADNPSLPPSLRFPLPLSPTVHPQSTSLSPSTDPSTLSSSLPPPFDSPCLPPFLASRLWPTIEEEIRAPALAHLKSYKLLYSIYLDNFYAHCIVWQHPCCVRPSTGGGAPRRRPSSWSSAGPPPQTPGPPSARCVRVCVRVRAYSNEHTLSLFSLLGHLPRRQAFLPPGVFVFVCCARARARGVC